MTFFGLHPYASPLLDPQVLHRFRLTADGSRCVSHDVDPLLHDPISVYMAF